MTATQDVNSLVMGSGGRSATFKVHGDQTWGVIVHSELRQQTDFDTGELMFWQDGKPRMQAVFTLQTDEITDDEDDGMRKVYAKGQMLRAIQAAVLKAGAKGVADGGTLLVRYTGDAEPKRKGMSGEKQYFAKYQPPAHTTVLPDQPDDEEPPIPDDLPF